MDHEQPTSPDAPKNDAAYQSTAKAKLWPRSGLLFRAPHAATQQALAMAVDPRCLREPMPVRPKLQGYLPFNQPEAGSDVPPVHVLSNDRLSVLRLGTITRAVPLPAIKRAKSIAVQAARAKAGRALTDVEVMTIESRAYSEVLQQALVDEREAPLFYQHHSGHIFFGERSTNAATGNAALLDSALKNHSCETFRFSRSPGQVMSQWLLDGRPPTGFDFGESALLVGSGKAPARAKFDKHELTSEEVLEHLRAGLFVQELALTYRDRVAFTLVDTGFVKGIALLNEPEVDEIEGQSEDLVRALQFADVVLPAIDAVYAAIGGQYGRMATSVDTALAEAAPA